MGLVLCANEKMPPGLRFLEFCFLSFVLFFFVLIFTFFFFFFLLQRFPLPSFKFARCLERLPFGDLSISAVHSFSANLTMLHHYFKFIYKADCLVFFEALYSFALKNKRVGECQKCLCTSFCGNLLLLNLYG